MLRQSIRIAVSPKEESPRRNQQDVGSRFIPHFLDNKCNFTTPLAAANFDQFYCSSTAIDGRFGHTDEVNSLLVQKLVHALNQVGWCIKEIVVPYADFLLRGKTTDGTSRPSSNLGIARE